MTKTLRDPDYEQRVRASFARQAAMATIGATLARVAPGGADHGQHSHRSTPGTCPVDGAISQMLDPARLPADACRIRGCCSMRIPGSLRVLAVIVALGCPTSETPDELAREATPESAAASAPMPWYRRARALDLTGDGQADSVRLEAQGPQPDSLGITLSLFVGGEEKHQERWGSSYELALVDSAARVRPRVEVVLRAQLDSVLASVVAQRLDAPGVRLMAEDRVVLAGLDPRPTHRVSFSYGYETTVRLVWDAPRERFVRLWSCC